MGRGWRRRSNLPHLAVAVAGGHHDFTGASLMLRTSRHDLAVAVAAEGRRRGETGEGGRTGGVTVEMEARGRGGRGGDGSKAGAGDGGLGRG